MTSNFKSFCRIPDYLEVHDDELYALLKGTCVISELMSLKGKDGITLLIPQGAFRKKITDLATSDSVDDFKKAADILRALVLRDVFKSASDWNAKRANIPNSQYPSQHLEIESATGKEVVTKSGAKLRIDDKFRDASNRGNLAVWNIVSGEILPTSDKPAKKRAPAPRGKAATGGRAAIEDIRATTRFKIINAVESAYYSDILKQRSGRSVGKAVIGGGPFRPLESRHRNAFLEAYLSLAHFAYHEGGDEGQRVFWQWILPHLSFNNADFYFVLQPFSRQPFISESLIEAWSEHNADMNFQETIDWLGHMLSEAPPGEHCAMYTDRVSILDSIDSIRSEDIAKCSGRDYCSGIIARYEYLETRNRIGDLDDILPAATAAYYSVHGGLRLAEDELRYVSWSMFRAVCTGKSEPKMCEHIFRRFREVLSGESKEEYGLTSMLFNPQSAFMIADVNKNQEAIAFINSTYYLFVPLNAAEVRSLPFKNQNIRPKLGSRIVWNLHDAAEKAASLGDYAASMMTSKTAGRRGAGASGGDGCGGGAGAGGSVRALNAMGAHSSPAEKEALRMAANRAGI